MMLKWQSNSNISVIVHACIHGYCHYYSWLLDYTDIDRTAQAKKGETAFHVAAAQGNLKVLEVCSPMKY